MFVGDGVVSCGGGMVSLVVVGLGGCEGGAYILRWLH